MRDDQFIGPAQGGEEPAKSKFRPSSSRVDGEGDGQGLVDHAVAVDEGAARRCRRGWWRSWPHLAGGAGADLGDGGLDGLVAVAVEQGGEAVVADDEGGRLGLDVADALVGDADVGRMIA